MVDTHQDNKKEDAYCLASSAIGIKERKERQ